MGGQNVFRACGATWAKLAGAAVVACVGWAGLTGPAAGAAETAAKAVDFNRDIKPVLTQSCVKCHRQDPRNPRGPAAKLRLDDKAAALKGGKSGPAIVPGKADESLLYKLLAGPVTVGDHEIAAMPKPQRNQAFKPLPKDKVALIKQWIDQGAKWSE